MNKKVNNKKKKEALVLRSFRVKSSDLVKLKKIAAKKKSNLSIVLRDLIDTL